jgi:hypothetical protein
MTSTVSWVNLSSDSTALITDYKARVLANGVALLFVYVVILL